VGHREHGVNTSDEDFARVMKEIDDESVLDNVQILARATVLQWLPSQSARTSPLHTGSIPRSPSRVPSPIPLREFANRCAPMRIGAARRSTRRHLFFHWLVPGLPVTAEELLVHVESASR
jgi:hypothetical protein